MSEIDVSIVVVNYNTRELTLACLASVYAETDARFELIVVDNASSDGSAEAIAERFPDLRLMALNRNLGFAAANNLAAREARGTYLLLLNPDTVVLDGAVDRVLAFAASHPQAGIWGGRTLFADRSLNPMSCWGRPTLWSVFCRAVGLASVFRGSRMFDSESLGGWARDSVRAVDIVTGCFFLMRKQDWDRLGGFDPAFFMYGEEADLCLRAKRAGFEPMITPDAVLVHYGGASEKVRSDKQVKLFKTKAQLFQRHWRPGAMRLGIRLLDVYALTRLTAFAVLGLAGGRFADARQTWREVWRRRGEWRQVHLEQPTLREDDGTEAGERETLMARRGSV